MPTFVVDAESSRFIAGRRLERDQSELRTLGSDTMNQRAVRLVYSGTQDELWEFMHEQGNEKSSNLKDTTFFQTRKDLTNDMHVRHMVPAQVHVETWPQATADVSNPEARLTREQGRMWAKTLEVLCEVAGRVFMDDDDAARFFAIDDRGRSERVEPWLARLDAILSVFGVHSRVTGSTLYTRMVYTQEILPKFLTYPREFGAWWLPKEKLVPGQQSQAKARVSLAIVGDSVIIPKGKSSKSTDAGFFTDFISRTVSKFCVRMKGGALAKDIIDMIDDAGKELSRTADPEGQERVLIVHYTLNDVVRNHATIGEAKARSAQDWYSLQELQQFKYHIMPFLVDMANAARRLVGPSGRVAFIVGGRADNWKAFDTSYDVIAQTTSRLCFRT
jgi:hypothetical protein